MSKLQRIAILGATSQIAKDLIISFSSDACKYLHLFARRPNDVTKWLKDVGLSERYLVDDYDVFGTHEYDAILNFVGVGNPAQAATKGASIFDVTLKYDELALNYVREHPDCRYIFLSSGAAYGSNFGAPADAESNALIPINNLQPQDWYGVAKLHAECRHRSLPHLAIVDIRVFNYFSHTQDIEARFLITDVIRAIKCNTVLEVSPDFIIRDFITPPDFLHLIECIIKTEPKNVAIDCYSKAPIDKLSLLRTMQEHFGLQFKFTEKQVLVNATGLKPHYYSRKKLQAKFNYLPEKTSMEGVLYEAALMLNLSHNK